MRFILKSAFFLGLAAFLMPGGGEDTATTGSVSLGHALVGAQQALADVTGFCGRAPDACAAGREVARFAGERIGDGVTLAYRLVGDQMAARQEGDPADAGYPSDDDIARILDQARGLTPAQDRPAGLDRVAEAPVHVRSAPFLDSQPSPPTPPAATGADEAPDTPPVPVPTRAPRP